MPSCKICVYYIKKLVFIKMCKFNFSKWIVLFHIVDIFFLILCLLVYQNCIYIFFNTLTIPNFFPNLFSFSYLKKNTALQDNFRKCTYIHTNLLPYLCLFPAFPSFILFPHLTSSQASSILHLFSLLHSISVSVYPFSFDYYL